MLHKILFDLFRATRVVPDPGAGKTISLTHNCHVQMQTVAIGEPRALPNPTKEGQEVCLVLEKVSNSGTVVATAAGAINTTGNTVMTFDTEGDWCKLESIKYFISGTAAYRWRVVDSDGCALS